jgi:nucleotide-binding universal stress UspA family protein
MKILVPTDFSPCAAAAFDWAMDLARRYRASVVLLHVHPVPAYAFIDGMVPPAPQDMAALAQASFDRLEQMADEHRGELPAGVRLQTEVRAGDPVEGILQVVHDRGIDLVVMGTHGRSGLAHLVLGSVAEKVVRRSDRPVLTVRGGPHGEHHAPPAA